MRGNWLACERVLSGPVLLVLPRIRLARSLRFSMANIVFERPKLMKFSIEIGEKERNLLEYHFNQLLGRLLIKVNNRTIKKALRLLNEPVLEVHVVVVGKHEKSTVRIEKERKPLLGHRNRLYVNNRLLKVFGAG